MAKDELPTYDDVLREKRQQSYQHMPGRPSVPNNYQPMNGMLGPPPPTRPVPISHNEGGWKPPALPWKYPPGYHCRKCANTGYKVKNGHRCRNCWKRFHQNKAQLRLNPMSPVPYGPVDIGNMMHSIPPIQLRLVPHAPAIHTSGLMLRPGDPRIGGYPCAECRGTGVIRFLLDKGPCPICHGIGRVF